MASSHTVGFIGLGQMGRPMARALANKGLSLALHDAHQEVARTLADELGAQAMVTPAEIGSVASVVILMLPNSRIVRDVVLGSDKRENALIATLAPGSIIIDMSSSDPVDTRELADILSAQEVHLVDAPVSGGVKKAESGSLAILIGGEPATIDQVRHVLHAMGEKLLHAGPLGAGHTMKALNNFVSAAGLAAASEALRIGTRFGVEPDTVIDILNASTGRNNSTENKFHQYILSETFASGFSLALMAKDIGIAKRLAQSVGLSSPLLEECEAQWHEAQSALEPNADHTAFIRYLDQQHV